MLMGTAGALAVEGGGDGRLAVALGIGKIIADPRHLGVRGSKRRLRRQIFLVAVRKCPLDDQPLIVMRSGNSDGGGKNFNFGKRNWADKRCESATGATWGLFRRSRFRFVITARVEGSILLHLREVLGSQTAERSNHEPHKIP